MPAAVLQLSPWVSPPTAPQPALAGEAKADVVVIGGGYTGLSTALALREKGADVVLLEQQFCGFGASGRNAGHLTPTIGKDAPTLALMFGKERAGALMRFADRAVRHAEDTIRRHGIDCDYIARANIIAGVHPRQEQALRKAAEAGAKLGAQLTWLDGAEMRRRGLPPAFTFGVLEGCGGHLHPGKYVTGLRAAAIKAGVRVHEQSAVTAIEDGAQVTVRTAQGAVAADQAVIATNAFTPVTLKRLGSRVCPVRVSLFRTPPLSAEQRARLGWPNREGVYTAHEILESYRIDGEGRIVGGSKVVNYAYGGGLPPAEQPETFALLERAFRDRFPMLDDVPVECFWGGWIGMTLDFLPLCGAMGAHRNVHYGVAYNGHGIAQATYMGRLLADRVSGVANEDAALLARRGIPIPPEPLRWLLVRGLIGLFAGMDRRVDRVLARPAAAAGSAPPEPVDQRARG
jgi:glycine/D-amino acid oxidase-like deaminating enzyme